MKMLKVFLIYLKCLKYVYHQRYKIVEIKDLHKLCNISILKLFFFIIKINLNCKLNIEYIYINTYIYIYYGKYNFR